MPRRLIVGLMATTVFAGTAIPAASAAPASTGVPTGTFPLGTPQVPKRTQTSVTSGVDLFHLRHGKATEGYTVTLLMPNGRDHGTLEQAQTVAAEVEWAGLGLTPRVERFIRPAVADAPAREYYAVRIGEWSLKQRAKADKLVAELRKANIRAKTDYLGDDGFATTGPWDVRVLTVDPRRFRGSYQVSVGKSVAKRETVSSMSRLAKAIAGVNGGFFNIHTARNLQGDPVGISVVGGKLLSEAVPGRSAVIFKGRTARITELRTSLRISSSTGARVEAHGINRAAKANELVVYTEEFGQKTQADGGLEAVVDTSGVILRVRDAGGVVPRGTWVLHGSGLAAEWMAAHVIEGGKLAFTPRVIDLRKGRTVTLTPQTHIMGGVVGLVRNGKIAITAKADGHDSVNMILRRHPRTLLGITRGGGLVLATVDGRKPGITVGASMIEAARLMRWLGARNAINLDGGGSSTMVVNHKVVNQPSDGAERPVGDALLITP